MIDNATAPVSEFAQAQEFELLSPLDDRIVVLPDSAEERIGSMYVPDTAQQRPARGTVVEVGPGVTKVHPGQRVLYGHFTGTEAMHGRAEVLLLREDDVYAIVHKVRRHPDGRVEYL